MTNRDLICIALTAVMLARLDRTQADELKRVERDATAVMSLSISLPRAHALAKMLELGFVPLTTPDDVAASYHWMGIDEKSIDVSQPLGFAYYDGEGLELGQGLVIGVPLKDGEGIIQDVVDRGAKRLGAGMARNGFGGEFRRVKHHMLFCGVPGLVTKVDPDVWKPAQQPNAVAHASIDMTLPVTKAAIKWAQQEDKDDSPFVRAVKRAIAKHLEKSAKHLEGMQLDVTLLHIDNRDLMADVKLKLKENAWAARKHQFKRPLMTDKAAVRVDFVHGKQSAAALVKAIDSLVDELGGNKLDEQLDASLRRLAKQLLRGDATSATLVFDKRGDGGRVHLIHQFADETNLAGAVERELKRLGKHVKLTIRQLETPDGGRAIEAKLPDYGLALQVYSKGKVASVIVQTAGPNARPLKLQPLKLEGELKHMLIIEADHSQVMRMVGLKRPRLGQTITLTGNPDGKAFACKLTAPVAVVKDIIEATRRDLPVNAEDKIDVE